MIGVGIALIVLGIVFLFVNAWVGIVAGAFGIVLAFLWIAGVSQTAVANDKRVGGDRI